MSLTSSNYNKLSADSKIGLNPVLLNSLEDDNSKPEYFINEMPKKLTRANSFMIVDEVFVIRKKDYRGKASKIYHVFKASGGRLVCSVPIEDKNEVIKLVTKKWSDYDCV